MTYFSGQLRFEILFKDMHRSKMPTTHGFCSQSMKTCKVSQFLYKKNYSTMQSLKRKV